MALEVEGVVDGGVDAEKPLRGASRLEALHLAFAPAHDLMRVLGAIVHPQPLLVRTGQAELPERGGSLSVTARLGAESLIPHLRE